MGRTQLISELEEKKTKSPSPLKQRSLPASKAIQPDVELNLTLHPKLGYVFIFHGLTLSLYRHFIKKLIILKKGIAIQ